MFQIPGFVSAVFYPELAYGRGSPGYNVPDAGVYFNFSNDGRISNFRCIYFPHPCNPLSAQQRGEEKVQKFEMRPRMTVS